MSESAIIAIIGSSSAILGAVIGVLGSFLTTRQIKKLDNQYNIENELRLEKRKIASLFMTEANRLVVHAMDERLSEARAISKLAELYCQIELYFNEEVSSKAKNLLLYVVSIHGQYTEEIESSFQSLREDLVSSIKNEIIGKT